MRLLVAAEAPIHRLPVRLNGQPWHLSTQPSGVLPSLICLFSSRLFRFFGTLTRLASTTWLHLGINPEAHNYSSKRWNSLSISP